MQSSTKILSFISIILIISICINICFYLYWYDHEYPHGYEDIDDLRTIEYHSDKYSFDDYYYVSFNDGYSYICGIDGKNKIDVEMDHWNNIFNTINFLIEKPHNSNCTYSFRIYYHTIDVPYECSSGHYKKKVMDDFELSSWGWNE